MKMLAAYTSRSLFLVLILKAPNNLDNPFKSTLVSPPEIEVK